MQYNVSSANILAVATRTVVGSEAQTSQQFGVRTAKGKPGSTKGAMSNQPSLFDSQASREARDKGISRVTKHIGSPWVAAAARDFAEYLRREGPAPSERWKEDYLRRGLEPPEHYNGYGAAVRYASQEGLIEATDRSVLAKSVTAHARRVQIWRAK